MVGYTDRSELTFSFQEPEITLQIQKESIVDGWEILPDQHPCKVTRITACTCMYNLYCLCLVGSLQDHFSFTDSERRCGFIWIL